MLDLRWRNLVASRPNALALHDAASGRSWTFADMASAADSMPCAGSGAFVHPSGTGAGFIIDVLRAWRSGAVTCPLEAGQAPPAVPPPPPGIAHLKFTSGTTGRPRCVAFTPAQLAADADAIVVTMGLHAGSPNLGVISMAHSYGFSSLVLPLLLHGIPLVLATSALPSALAGAADVVGKSPLTLPAVPALWRAWHEANAIPRTVRLAISAGAPLPIATESGIFAASGLKVHNFIGASECGGIAYDASPTPRANLSMAGHPMAGVRIEVGDDGRLSVQGPAVGSFYWPDPSGDLADGRYRTGDLGEVLSSGEVLVHGRAVDRINVAGRKVSPVDIEAVLGLHPMVRECLVLGLPALDARGEVVVAVVAARAPVPATFLRDFLLQRLPPWQVPRRWHFVDAVQANGRGKVSRADWARRLADAPQSHRH